MAKKELPLLCTEAGQMLPALSESGIPWRIRPISNGPRPNPSQCRVSLSIRLDVGGSGGELGEAVGATVAEVLIGLAPCLHKQRPGLREARQYEMIPGRVKFPPGGEDGDGGGGRGLRDI